MFEIKPETLISYCAIIVSFCSLLLVYFQVKIMSKQLQLDSLIRLKEINRELIVLGFNDPELFQILNGVKVDSEKEKRYLQLWLNQIDVIWHAKKSNLFSRDYHQGLEKDIADTFHLESMRRHWSVAKQYYSEGFRQYIDGIIQGKPEKLPTTANQYEIAASPISQKLSE